MLSVAPSETFILASSSPRRRELLASVGIEFSLQVPNANEDVLPYETGEALVQRLALVKAVAVAERNDHAWVLGADTTVEVDGEILGKPEDTMDAIRMLQRIAGRTHNVWGGFALVCRARGIEHVEVHRSLVEMRVLSFAECEAYVQTGEPMDKAGSYGIQHIGAGLVSSVTGSYTNVVGLNLAAVIQAGQKHGLFVVNESSAQ